MRKKRVVLGILFLTLLIGIYIFINYAELKSVYNKHNNVNEMLKDMDIYLGGDAVGIKLLATGVLVIGVDDENLEKIFIGDIILKVDDEEINTGNSLAMKAKNSNGKKLKLEINRQGKIINIDIIPKYDELANEYKLGLFVKDSSAGVGTITFYDKNTKKFAGLGHGVTETKENYILPITTGAITTTHIYMIKKGEAKNPGEIKGTITNDILGEIYGNTNKGIYGRYFLDNMLSRKVEIMPKLEIKEGEAQIIVMLEDGIKKEYKIEIEKVMLTSTGNKNMIIRITDEELLGKTGGIIQGMSGCPILQDEKLCGAVTHVFLNDSTRGYGVFIENMIEDMNEFIL